MITPDNTSTVRTQLQERIDQLKVQLKNEVRRDDRVSADLTKGEMYGLRYALQLLQE